MHLCERENADGLSRDLPFNNPRDLPDVFTSYRKSVEPLREAPRKVLPAPKSLLFRLILLVELADLLL